MTQLIKCMRFMAKVVRRWGEEKEEGVGDCSCYRCQVVSLLGVGIGDF